eukprot:6178550-Pleurochrysis_carterae.AAC.3
MDPKIRESKGQACGNPQETIHCAGRCAERRNLHLAQCTTRIKEWPEGLLHRALLTKLTFTAALHSAAAWMIDNEIGG